MQRLLSNPLRRTALTSLCLLFAAALFTPAISAQSPNKDVKFEVISLRPAPPGIPNNFTINPTPDGFVSTLTGYQMIMLAYAHEDFILWAGMRGSTTLANAPSWVYDGFYISARVANSDLQAWQHQGKNNPLLRSAMQALLRDRFHLVLRQQPSVVPIFKLVAAKNNKLKPANPNAIIPSPHGTLPGGGLLVSDRDRARHSETIHFYNTTMTDLANELTGFVLRHVDNATNLTGRYDFTLVSIDHGGNISPEDAADLLTLHELGLDLKTVKGQGLTLHIDHIEKPTPN